MSRNIRNMPLYQSDASHNRTLLELKRRAEAGERGAGYDDTTSGSKNNEYTLGLCDDEIEAARDGVYPRDHHHCPHDARYFDVAGNPIPAEPDLNGCFYTCRFFQRRIAVGDPVARVLAVQSIAEVLPAGDR